VHAHRAAVAVLAAAAVLAGCGGPMRPEELGRSIQTIESSAAEGALVADGVARDRTKATFVRVHARDLGDVVDHEAEKLHDASAGGDVAARKARAVKLAGRVSQALGDLQTAPDSETTGTEAKRALDDLARRAGRLAEGL
jgi:hypothetical protein